MLCLLVLLVLVAVAWLWAWPRTRPARAAPPDVDAAPWPGPASAPRTLEDALTRQLLAGKITGQQYRNAMADIAARDDERHPLDVPPETA